MKIRFIFLLLLSPSALAHYIPSLTQATTVDASLAVSWSSASQVGDYDFWQIPGTLMGGDAWPTRKGVDINEMNIGLSHRLDDNLFAVIKLGSHSAGTDSHGAVDLEHAYVGWVCCDEFGPWVVEAGKMSALFSPALGVHGAERLSSDTPLVLDVLFGRHFHDQGIRFWLHETGGFSVGAELWKGQAFPATDSEKGGAWDIFGRYQWQGQRLHLSAGAWLYSATAEARADHRYGGGHQHNPVAPPGQAAAPFPDIRYSGDTNIGGLHGAFSYQLNQRWQLGMEAEWMQAKLDGIVHKNTGIQAQLDGTHSGGWLQPFITRDKHTLAIRAELLSMKNTLTGPAAPVLAAESGLANPLEHDPQRLSLIWRWQWRDHLALRAQAVRDNSLVEREHYLLLGVVWQQRLWPHVAAARDHHH